MPVFPAARRDGVVLLAALLLLYAPTLRRLWAGPWQESDHSYAPVLLLLAAGVAAWRLHQGMPRSMARGIGWPLLFCGGLALLLLGTLLGNFSIQALSAPPALAGAIGSVWGGARVKALRLPLAITLFAVPLPGSLITALTFPLKMAVSACATAILALAGLPVARQGVTIDIGNYQLLVAEACSGLQSMYSLLAVALFYLAVSERRTLASSLLLLAASLPLAFLANVARVVALALVTHLFGEAAGQGFLHGVAGLLMFAFAFAGLMLVDRVIERLGIPGVLR